MAKAVKSDGAVDAAMLRLCEEDWSHIPREAIDAKLADKLLLRQLKYATLCYVGYRYATAYGTPSWHVHARLETTAACSSDWRNFAKLPAPDKDPLQALEDAFRSSADED